MKKQKDFTIIELLIIVAILIFPISWGYNLVQLSECDFEPNYRCELLHSIGIIPTFAPVTIWFDTDTKE